jgi:hypothetical protein
MKTISKKETSRRFGVVPSMITKYISQGMPVTGSGKINWNVAQKWRADNVHPELSGNFAARQRKAQAAQSREFLPDMILDDIQDMAPAVSCRSALDRILSQRNKVGFILAELGIKDPVLLCCVNEIFCLLVLQFSGMWDLIYPLDGPDIPLLPDVDYDALSLKSGVTFTDEMIAAADKMSDAAYAVIEKEVER